MTDTDTDTELLSAVRKATGRRAADIQTLKRVTGGVIIQGEDLVAKGAPIVWTFLVSTEGYPKIVDWTKREYTPNLNKPMLISELRINNPL